MVSALPLTPDRAGAAVAARSAVTAGTDASEEHPGGARPATALEHGAPRVAVALRSADRNLITQVRVVTELVQIPVLLCPPGTDPPDADLLLDSPTECATPESLWPGATCVAVRDQLAHDTRVAPVLLLPHDGEDLLRLIRRAARVRRATVVGVMGARGGVGASSLAAVLARASAASNARTGLVGLGTGAGIDLTLGIESDPGVRWADLEGSDGRYDPQELVAALPLWRDVRVLSADARGAPPPVAGVEVLGALSDELDVVVLDIGHQHGWHEWIGQCDAVVLLAGCDVLSAAGLRAIRRLLGQRQVDLVVRGPAPGGLTAQEVAEAAGLPLTLAMRAERTMAAGSERGVAPGDRASGPLARAGRELARTLQLHGPQS